MTYAMIGAGGYIAPRHMKAIEETGGTLVAAMDVNDSVGVLDSYFPECQFFTEYERFDRHIEKLRRTYAAPDFMVVCSPNYLHDSHCRLGMRLGMNVICEKPVCINPRTMDALHEDESLYGQTVYPIMQCRLHPQFRSFAEDVLSARDLAHVTVEYITPRGPWYCVSWKGSEEKSGGLLMNIGFHLFDVLSSVFGHPVKTRSDISPVDAKGEIEFEHARVSWHLSIGGTEPRRLFKMHGKKYDFTSGFTDLHTRSYQKILDEEGFRLSDCKDTLHLIETIRTHDQNS